MIMARIEEQFVFTFKSTLDRISVKVPFDSSAISSKCIADAQRKIDQKMGAIFQVGEFLGPIAF